MSADSTTGSHPAGNSPASIQISQHAGALDRKLQSFQAELETTLLSPETAAIVPREQMVQATTIFREPVPDQNFEIVVVGGFKRGKSTLVNALLGAEILPTDPLPETITINRLQYAETFQVYGELASGGRVAIPPDRLKREALEVYLQQLPEDVISLTVLYPAEVLRHVTFTDTPGMGDLFRQFDTLVVDYLQQADLVLSVVSATAPLSLEEQAFLKMATGSQLVPKMAFVVTMLDLFPKPEEHATVMKEISRRIYRLFPAASIFSVSALDELREDPQSLSHLAHSSFLELRDFLGKAIGFQSDLVIGLRRIRRMNGWVRELLHELRERNSDYLADRAVVDDESTAHPSSTDVSEEIEHRCQQFRTVLDRCRMESETWMEAFVARLDRELFANAKQFKSVDLQKHLHFFLVNVIGDAFKACVREHWETLADAAQLEKSDSEHIQPLADQLAVTDLAIGLGDWAPTDASHFVGHLMQTPIFRIIPGWSMWASGAAAISNLVAGASRPGEIDEIVHHSVNDFRQRLPEIKAQLRQRVTQLYEKIGEDMEAAIRECGREWAEKANRSAEQAALLAASTAAERKDVVERLDRLLTQLDSLVEQGLELEQVYHRELEATLLGSPST